MASEMEITKKNLKKLKIQKVKSEKKTDETQPLTISKLLGISERPLSQQHVVGLQSILRQKCQRKLIKNNNFFETNIFSPPAIQKKSLL